MKLRLVIAFVCFAPYLFSQGDTLTQDSIPSHSIKKAVIFSCALPGAGQVYNYLATEKKTKGRNTLFFKLPIFYAALGATGYMLIQNQVNETSVKKEYNYRQDNGGLKLNDKWAEYDDISLVQLYGKYSTRRDLFIIAFGATYLFQVIDAGIGAHFVKFDLSEDLTLQVRPKIFSPTTVGIGFNINFR
jgi:hypothetical protein